MSSGVLTLKKKIILLVTIVTCVIGASAWALLYGAEKKEVVDYAYQTLKRYLVFAQSQAEKNGLDGLLDATSVWSELYPDGRVTIMDASGAVMTDTKADAAQMENHYTRAEVSEALADEDGEGTELRYSKTKREWQIYLAKKITLGANDVCVARLSYPVEKLSALVENVTVPFIKYFAAILVTVWGGACLLIRALMSPLNSITEAAGKIARGEEARFPITYDGEARTLADALNRMQDALKETINESKERKEELSQLVGALPVGVILIDDERKIRYINEEAASICGAAETPKRGSAVEMILPANDLYKMLDEPDGVKKISVTRAAGALTIEATSLALPRGRLIVLHDTTEKSRLEEVRRDFFIGAGHEFQTPLAIIRTGLELLKSSPALSGENGAEETQTIESILRQQERISGLIDDMLLLARLDGEYARRGTERVNIEELAEEIKKELLSLPREKKTQIETDFPKGGAWTSANRSELRRALFNVIENALKYIRFGKEPSGVIKVTARESADAWLIAIDDNGPGVPESEREFIFEPFRRGDGHRARGRGKTGGYGLGLSVSKKIFEKYGGKITLRESALNGAAFEIALPKAGASEK